MGVGGAISGGVLTETIFNWPGIGRYLVSSTLQQDYPVVQATFFILALITIISNVVADILYAYLDPRVRI
jgi:ABC-type dipeptide/oligopeptide/nickel transport system permease component